MFALHFPPRSSEYFLGKEFTSSTITIRSIDRVALKAGKGGRGKGGCLFRGKGGKLGPRGRILMN
jgi:hypothetical protein